MPRNERRKSARLVESLHFKILYQGFDISSTTLNLSMHGLLCRIAQSIPVMTKIDMILLMPQKRGRATRKIKIKGVVVRSEKNPKDSCYELAIFFTEIPERHKGSFEAYVQKTGGLT